MELATCLVILLTLISTMLFPLGLVGSVEITEYYAGERDALIQLRDSPVSSGTQLHANWTGPPCYRNSSRWIGINCSNSHVTGLVLDDIGLTGSLPPAPFLQNITFLTELSFRRNSISGPLPNLTGLSHLKNMFLSGNLFTGSIPSQYIELPSLKNLELQQNYLQGTIPAFNQPTLTDFNVSYNQLGGPIPSTEVLQQFPKSSYDHNLNLCGIPLDPCPIPAPSPHIAPPSSPPSPQPPPHHGRKKKLHSWYIVLIAAAVALVTSLFVVLFLLYYRKVHDKDKRTEGGDDSEEWSNKKLRSRSKDDPERRVEIEFVDKDVAVFDLNDLLSASAQVLGKGQIGTTYKASLDSGTIVAVKRLRNNNSVSKKEFEQQMQLLGNLKHDNLTRIIAFHCSKDSKLVITEFVPHGNLFELLHENRGVGREAVNWRERLRIIRDIAKGLAYLHETLASHKVPHGDLKSSNVLISHTPQDSQSQGNSYMYHAKLADYGFFHLLPPASPSSSSTKTRKTQQQQKRKNLQKQPLLAATMAPEFSQLGKKLTSKADVYCFGILLLEIITGRLPPESAASNNGEEERDDLSEWVRTVVHTDWSTDILDVDLLASRESHDDMLKLTRIALQCTELQPHNRPNMSSLLRTIQDFFHSSPNNI